LLFEGEVKLKWACVTTKYSNMLYNSLLFIRRFLSLY